MATDKLHSSLSATSPVDRDAGVKSRVQAVAEKLQVHSLAKKIQIHVSYHVCEKSLSLTPPLHTLSRR